MAMKKERIHDFLVYSSSILDKWQTQVQNKSLENWKEQKGMCAHNSSRVVSFVFHEQS